MSEMRWVVIQDTEFGSATYWYDTYEEAKKYYDSQKPTSFGSEVLSLAEVKESKGAP